MEKGAARSSKNGGAWIYDNEVKRIEGDFTNGDLMTVLDFDGYPLGSGFLSIYSKLRVRTMMRYIEQQVDEAFLRQHFLDAARLRKQVINTPACRLVFGEAGLLLGLTVGKFGDVLVLESLAFGMDRTRETVLQFLFGVPSDKGLPIRGVYERSDAEERLKEGMERHKGFLSASFDTKVEIREDDVRYLVDVIEGQKTGFFLDQKLDRRVTQRLTSGVRALDCFTCTRPFALSAGLTGARGMLGVDASAPDVAQATENATLNGFPAHVCSETASVFELLSKPEAAKERFELVILDPPALIKPRETIECAVKGYWNINLRRVKLAWDGDFLVTCSCSYSMDQKLFARILQEAARGTRKCLRQVYFSTQVSDHLIF